MNEDTLHESTIIPSMTAQELAGTESGRRALERHDLMMQVLSHIHGLSNAHLQNLLVIVEGLAARQATTQPEG